MYRLITLLLVCCLGRLAITAQDETGPQQPIVLEHADSLLGSGQADAAMREFEGHVRFRQGNVTVTCDRAIHYIGSNRADFIGRVRIVQGGMTIEAPFVTYDGTQLLASATKGVTIKDGARTVRARRGVYSTKTHVADFDGDVRVVDDSVRIVADTVRYERDTKVSVARSNVVVAHRDGSSWVKGDTVIHDPTSNTMVSRGHAEAWQLTSTDTTYITSDTLETFRGADERHLARGNASIVRGSVSARADTMDYRIADGTITLRKDPVVWSDSTMLTADTIIIDAPERTLRMIRGLGTALMVSRTDTVRTDRYDQLSGRRIEMDIERDTLRRLTAIGETRSIYYRVEEEEPKGLAQFSSDTTKVMLVDGTPEDIHWLGAIHGEHHPENIVAGRPTSYRLPGFRWRTDRPIRALPPDVPFLRTGEL
jgi:lipopolysaccharide export system protein LptA